MRNQKVLRGFALIAVALFFGLQAATYHLGTLASAGAGLFPLMMLVQSRFEPAVHMSFSLKNIGLILASLIGFVLIAKHSTMLLAIPYLVFVASLAGTGYSVLRNLKISVVLIGIAFGFHYFLGLSLPLL